MSLPWYKWYASDWVRCETRFRLSAAERGIFRDLLDLHYLEGSIPKNPRVLVGFLSVLPNEFEEAWKNVSELFVDHPSDPERLVNRRALDEIQSLESRRQVQRNNGLKGGRPKKKTHGLAKRNPRVSHGIAKQKPSESESDTEDNPSLPLRGISPLIALGEHGWVRLTESEHGKLVDLLGPHLSDYVERFDLWVQENPEAKTSSGKRKDRNPYLTIRQWFNRDKTDNKLPKVTYGHSTDQKTDPLAEAARRRATRRAGAEVASDLRGGFPAVRGGDDSREGGSLLRIAGGLADQES